MGDLFSSLDIESHYFNGDLKVYISFNGINELVGVKDVDVSALKFLHAANPLLFWIKVNASLKFNIYIDIFMSSEWSPFDENYLRSTSYFICYFFGYSRHLDICGSLAHKKNNSFANYLCSRLNSCLQIESGGDDMSVIRSGSAAISLRYLGLIKLGGDSDLKIPDSFFDCSNITEAYGDSKNLLAAVGEASFTSQLAIFFEKYKYRTKSSAIHFENNYVMLDSIAKYLIGFLVGKNQEGFFERKISEIVDVFFDACDLKNEYIRVQAKKFYMCALHIYIGCDFNRGDSLGLIGNFYEDFYVEVIRDGIIDRSAMSKGHCTFIASLIFGSEDKEPENFWRNGSKFLRAARNDNQPPSGESLLYLDKNHKGKKAATFYKPLMDYDHSDEIAVDVIFDACVFLIKCREFSKWNDSQERRFVKKCCAGFSGLPLKLFMESKRCRTDTYINNLLKVCSPPREFLENASDNLLESVLNFDLGI